MFLEGSVRSTRSTSFSGRRATSSRSAARTSSLLASSSNSAGSTEIGCTVTSELWPSRAAVPSAKSHAAPARSLEARRKFSRQRCVWKPITSFASRPSWISRRVRPRQHVPVVGLGPRDVDEVGQQRLRGALAHEPRREVELVVVEEDGCVRLELELLQHCVREALVDPGVALLPGVLEGRVQRGRVGELPQVVLQKPEHRVGDHVVEPVVGRLVVRDQPQAERRPVAGGLLDRGPAALLDDGPVLVGHRAGDPGDVVMRDEAA